VSTATQTAYFSALAEETNADEWLEFCRVAPKMFGWEFLPSAPKLFDALRSFRGEPSRAELDRQLSTEAGEAYQAVMDSGIYTAEGGTSWNYRTVVEKCGRAAGEAFVSAGGPTAWATTWDEAKRRERFLAAYQVAVRESPALSMRALPAPKVDDQKQIGAGEEKADPQITQAEAKGLLEKLREIIPADIPQAPKVDAFAVNCDPQRYADLKAQAERIKLEDGAKAS
jgi:hypothetical protein